MRSLSLYDDPAFYDARSHPEPFASYYAEAAQEAGGPVLELGCGTGQIIVPVARTGLRSVGLDRSPAMLAAARTYGESSGAPIEWLEGDMRSFELEGRFSTVIIARNTLLQLTEIADLRACLRAVRRHLLPGGSLVFDIFNPDLRILTRPAEERQFVRKFWFEGRGEVTLELTSDYDSASQVNRGTWYHSTSSEPDFLVTPIHLRCIFPQELPLLLELEGFRLAERWGGFSREPFRGNSRHQVCTARCS